MPSCLQSLIYVGQHHVAIRRTFEGGKLMKTRAAVALAAGQPLEIMEVDLDGPRAGEVLVEIMATGICHTDAFTLSGADPEGCFQPF